MKKALAEMLDSTHLEKSAQEIVNRFIYHLKYQQGKDRFAATAIDCYLSFALAIRDLLLDQWLVTQASEYALQRKRVYYLSMEYLIGRSLSNAILNLGITRQAERALQDLGYDLSTFHELEWDAGLGNGGLGRLAACFLDSMSSLKIPVYGYGIRYEYGIFFQHIKACEQVETPDNWLRYGSVWEIAHPQRLYPVHFGGSVKPGFDCDGNHSRVWQPSEAVMAMAYDYLIPGYKNAYVNTLRLFSAKSTRDFNLNYFNEGEYVQAVADKNHSEIISKVLYPNDNNMQGKKLRLKQEYFFVCATIQDILRRFLKKTDDFTLLPEFAAIQLNDTHPAIAVAELMRILVDDKGLPWEIAWDITRKTCNFTNHTILPEALEKWSVELMHQVLPRHLEIIYEINQRFLDAIQVDSSCRRRLSLIEEEPVKSVRMAHLAIIGSHKVNGVSKLHTQILKERVFKDFYELNPDQFIAITNGITPRRWLMLCNPRLSDLIDKAIGKSWRRDLRKISKLRQMQKDLAFQEDLAEVKLRNKKDFCLFCKKNLHVELNPDSIFDFHAKRLHEYKRQLLNALHIIHLIHEIREGKEIYPHSFFFAGKAAPGYKVAKLIISLICHLGEYIKHNPELAQRLSVNFLPNYNVSLAQRIMPAAELSQQISLAGTEASGTGNMKFALNGALTVGTLDGANIEIREQVGAENFFPFGLKANEVVQLKSTGYHPYQQVQANPDLARIMSFLGSGELSPLDPLHFEPLLKLLLYDGDQYCLIQDLPDYIRVMKDVERSYREPSLWNQMSAANIAGMGVFSADEAIKKYAKEVWNLKIK
ncbi:MAG: glycogen phosphorylase [Candidatus Cloacimonadota bacterium]|nr:glycogen phosphorylase [Candidatus Cloacimonadota bacterium]